MFPKWSVCLRRGESNPLDPLFSYWTPWCHSSILRLGLFTSLLVPLFLPSPLTVSSSFSFAYSPFYSSSPSLLVYQLILMPHFLSAFVFPYFLSVYFCLSCLLSLIPLPRICFPFRFSCFLPLLINLPLYSTRFRLSSCSDWFLSFSYSSFLCFLFPFLLLYLLVSLLFSTPLL